MYKANQINILKMHEIKTAGMESQFDNFQQTMNFITAEL